VRLQDDINLARYGDLRAFINYSYNDARYTSTFHTDSDGATLADSGALVTKGEELGDVPEQLVSFGGTWTDNGWRVTLRGRYIGPQQTLDYNTGVPDGVKIEGYYVMDLGLAKTFTLHGLWVKTFKIGVDFNNILNKYYYNYADTSTKEDYFKQLTEFASPGAPRNILAKMDFGF
jgi:hypothetical protein